MTPEEQAEFDGFVNEANFRIEILEQRAAKHQEQALDRYVEMDQKLQNDPILSALKQVSGGN